MKYAKATQKILEKEVQRLTREVSSKFVTEPSIEVIRDDLLVALKRYNHSVRQKWRRIKAAKKANTNPNLANNCEDPTRPAGLGTNLRPTNGWSPDPVATSYRDVEAYLREVQIELLTHLNKMAKNDKGKSNPITDQINSLLSKF